MGILKITADFKDGEEMPRRYGKDNGNVSPRLTILLPAGTKSVALIMDDPDALEAVGKVWVHWVMYNLDTKSILKHKVHNVQIREGNPIPDPLTRKQFHEANTKRMQDENKAHLIQCQEQRYGPKTTDYSGKNQGLLAALTGLNDWDKFDYGGPAPPSGTHTYRIKAYALNTPHLNLPRFDEEEGVMRAGTKADVEDAMKGPVTKGGHILEDATLTGTYQSDKEYAKTNSSPKI